MFLRVAILCTLAVILINCDFAAARTRYEEFDYPGCQSELSATVEAKKLVRPLETCAQFCTNKEFPHGGCDCATKKCVCANMNLDFCDFQRIRLFI